MRGDVDLNDLKSAIGSRLGKSDLTLQTGSDISGNRTLTVTLPGSDTLTTEQLDNLLASMNEAVPRQQLCPERGQQRRCHHRQRIPAQERRRAGRRLCADSALCGPIVSRKIGGLKAGSTAIIGCCMICLSCSACSSSCAFL